MTAKTAVFMVIMGLIVLAVGVFVLIDGAMGKPVWTKPILKSRGEPPTYYERDVAETGIGAILAIAGLGSAIGGAVVLSKKKD